jgi:hypothetical protein
MKTKMGETFQTCRMFIGTDRNQACSPSEMFRPFRFINAVVNPPAIDQS